LRFKAMLHSLAHASLVLLQTVSAAAVSAVAAAFTVEELQLHAWAVEIMSAATVIGGGAMLLWTRWQNTQIAAARQWQQVQAASLSGELADLKKRNEELETALSQRNDEFQPLTDECRELRRANAALLERLADQPAPKPAPDPDPAAAPAPPPAPAPAPAPTPEVHPQ